MHTFFYVLAALLPVAALIAITVYSMRLARQGMSGKKILSRNLLGFLAALVLIGVFTFAVTAQTAPAVEQQEEAAIAPASDGINKGLGLLAAALVTSLAGIGGGIAVAAGAPAAIAATSEDPKSFGKSLIFVALGESIALYGVVISILILNKV